MKKLLAKFLSVFRAPILATQTAVVSVCKNVPTHSRFASSTTDTHSGRTKHARQRQNVSALADYRSGSNSGTLSEKLCHLQIGLVGFNLKGFAIRYCASSDDAGLVHEIAELPTHVKMVRQRDVAGGVRIALQMLSRFSQGRTGIIILTSGGQTRNTKLAHELVQTAANWKTGMHVINIGHRNGRGCPDLAALTTRSALGYGQLRNVSTESELRESSRLSLNGLRCAPGMADISSVVVLVDCSERMGESFQGTTRIEMVSSALRDRFCNSFVRGYEKRMALTA